MDKPIPTTSEVRAALMPMGYAQVQALAARSNVPLTTLWKIRIGETANPGIETVRKFWQLIDTPDAPPVPATAQAA